MEGASEDVWRSIRGYPDEDFYMYAGIDANVTLPRNVRGITGESVISTKTTHKEILNKMMDWVDSHQLQALNTFWKEGGEREDEDLWTRRRWEEKGVRKRYVDRMDGIKRRRRESTKAGEDTRERAKREREKEDEEDGEEGNEEPMRTARKTDRAAQIDYLLVSREVEGEAEVVTNLTHPLFRGSEH